MKGYKASYDGWCRDLRYKVGSTYIFKGTIEMCKRGFHFCQKPEDVLGYYSGQRPDLKIFEVEASGYTEIGENKTVTDRLKVIREIPLSEIGLENINNKDGMPLYTRIPGKGEYIWAYDKAGNLVYEEDFDGTKYWVRYDENGNCTNTVSNRGMNTIREYDEKGNKVREVGYNGEELIWKYDASGNVTYHKDIFGRECKWEYNDLGKPSYKCVVAPDMSTRESWYEYNDSGKETHCRNSNGTEYWYEYDEHDNPVHYKHNSGDEWWAGYDAEGRETYKCHDEFEMWTEYNESGCTTYHKCIEYQDETRSEIKNSTVLRWEYDWADNESYHTVEGEYERWSVYDALDHLIYFKDTDGREIRKLYDASGSLIYCNEGADEEWSIEIEETA